MESFPFILWNEISPIQMTLRNINVYLVCLSTAKCQCETETWNELRGKKSQKNEGAEAKTNDDLKVSDLKQWDGTFQSQVLSTAVT